MNDIESMVKIYNTKDIDWMGESINSVSDLTRHHIIKKEYGGCDNINNYALLSFNSHSLIHYLEINYNKEYNYLNSLFLELNRSKKEPSKEYYELVSSVLKRVKKDIKNKRRGRK